MPFKPFLIQVWNWILVTLADDIAYSECNTVLGKKVELNNRAKLEEKCILFEIFLKT